MINFNESNELNEKDTLIEANESIEPNESIEQDDNTTTFEEIIESDSEEGNTLTYPDATPLRIDKFLADSIPNLTRTYIQKLIVDEKITVNNKSVKSNYKLSQGDEIYIAELVPQELSIVAQDIPVDIIYEDDALLIVNKPVGMVVHPAPGNYTDTLVNAIMYHCKDRLSSINGIARPGIVHRIDKDTSGLLIICKTDVAHSSIAAQLKDHSIKRVYVGIVYNNLKEEEGTIDAPIGRGEKDRKRMAINYKNGKHAITHYKVIERFTSPKYTYASFQLETGRTHQIRLHMAMLGNPRIGDPLYGPKNAAFADNGQVLHAKTIGFIHPITQEYMEFEVSPPEKFTRILEKLRNNSK